MKKFLVILCFASMSLCALADDQAVDCSKKAESAAATEAKQYFQGQLSVGAEASAEFLKEASASFFNNVNVYSVTVSDEVGYTKWLVVTSNSKGCRVKTTVLGMEE